MSCNNQVTHPHNVLEAILDIKHHSQMLYPAAPNDRITSPNTEKRHKYPITILRHIHHPIAYVKILILFFIVSAVVTVLQVIRALTPIMTEVYDGDDDDDDD